MERDLVAPEQTVSPPDSGLTVCQNSIPKLLGQILSDIDDNPGISICYPRP